MAGNGSNAGGGLSGETGIPSGLNRIKIRRVRSKKDRLNHRAENSASLLGPSPAEQKTVKDEHGNIKEGKEGFRKGKKIARWFTSYLTKDSNQMSSDILPNTEVSSSEVKMLDQEGIGGTKHSIGKELSSESTRNIPKGFKSFSHELGPKGGIRPSHPRAHSYNDLKEILGSLRTRFDTAKVVVNAELVRFTRDVEEVLVKNYSSSPKGQESMKDLLILAQQCTEMTSAEFRAKCEVIVQDLAEKRQQCQAGLMKQLFTRMLFILTRCTRLLQFDKDSELIDEDSLHKFKRCLESIPTVEMSWVPKQGSTDFGSDGSFNKKDSSQYQLQGKHAPPEESDTTLRKDFIALAQKLQSQNSQVDVQSNEIGITKPDSQSLNASQRRKVIPSYEEDNIQQCHQADSGFPGRSLYKLSSGSLNEQHRSFDGSDSVICRICEEVVPTSHLESHSYVCAYADKCDSKCLDVDERLSKLADVLEQIIESCTLSHNASNGSPEISRIQTENSAVGSEGQSPKIIEWHNKGVEGMFEDLHEMDTACIDDSHFATSSNFKGHMSMKLGHHGAPSSTGSMTSVSSTNTPRASHFDLFWLEHNNTSEIEDVHQMAELVEIARCAASKDLTEEGVSDYLLGCMYDLQDILQRSKLKALVIDTFGSRLENLLREKCLLTCEMLDNQSPKDVSKYKGIGGWVDTGSQSSTLSTPVHPTHKERTSIDDFDIIKPISRGAFGKVFLARKRTTGDLFAIKVLKKLDMIQKNDIERILAERNILITVRNPFVVRFFYSFTCRDNLYLVMEYLNGGDLYSLLRKVGCLEEDVARTYIAELVLALEYLHSLGIVHRDLKPDNILIAHDGHIKLTDFGLSKIGLINNTVDLSGSEANGTILDADDVLTSFEHAQQTEERSHRSAVGTPDYLAPEILLGTEHGYAADWWSVGIILYEFITGIPPFTAGHPEIIFDNILNMKIPWPAVPNDMSYEAQDLINRFLINDPDQRLGANGASEVKAHPFFKGVNWDTLALQKAAFVPNPDGADDTSYFMSRYSHISNEIPEDQNFSDSASDATDSCSNSGVEMDEFGELANFESSLDLSLINFSFKNLAQLASINYDVLLQRDPSNCSSPSRCHDS